MYNNVFNSIIPIPYDTISASESAFSMMERVEIIGVMYARTISLKNSFSLSKSATVGENA